MNDHTQSQTESLLDIIRGIDNKTIMLPEFQRDFRWEMEQTYDLFDSLIRNIFIGTIIYGKPAFGMTLREIDKRERRGRKGRIKLETTFLSTEEITHQGKTKNLRIVLDGQQRITSIYRAITGIDEVYVYVKKEFEQEPQRITPQTTLEELAQEITGAESHEYISVKLYDAYRVETEGSEEEEQTEWFHNSKYGKTVLANPDKTQRKNIERTYRRVLQRIRDLYKQQKMVAYYLLDMDLEKFCLFFERSNSRGIQLNFIDILAAKLYRGFNLRQKIEDFENDNGVPLNREIIVRAIAYISGVERTERNEAGGISIDRGYILKNLDVDDFNNYWDDMCLLYLDCWNYLKSQRYVVTPDWIPSENMVLPMMMFRRELRGFDAMSETQRQFLEYWYWASVFANRYSGSSNETIIADSSVLINVARGEHIRSVGYFTRLRSLITSPDDLFTYTKRASGIYRGVLNLIGYAAGGLHDWSSSHKIDPSMSLEDHHIYARAYINGNHALDITASEAEQLCDSVVNRTLIPKKLNIKVGKKPPQQYLAELLGKNPALQRCLASHLIPIELIEDESWNIRFREFLEQRAAAIFALVEKYAISPEGTVRETHADGEISVTNIKRARKLLLVDLMSMGLVQSGDMVYINTNRRAKAKLIDGNHVDFNGQKLTINEWARQVTGWKAVNIYEWVFLERTQTSLDSIREQHTSTS